MTDRISLAAVRQEYGPEGIWVDPYVLALLDVAEAARELAVRLHDNPDAPQAAYDELLRTLDRFEWERA